MTLAQWLIVLLACAGGAISPGPSLALVTRHAVASPASGLICAWSHAVGVACYATLAVTGLGMLMSSHPAMLRLTWLGAGLWLMYLAVVTWCDGERPDVRSATPGVAVRDGFSMALANPKIIVFFVALFAAAVPSQADAAGRMLAVTTAFVVDGLWYSLVSLGIRQAAVHRWLRMHVRALARVSALILSGFAIAAIAQAMISLRL